ncbi:WD repeat-containing protein [Coprinopsis cinerea AmutBmut pab1-1]|nr:WD repeat-containing protein [Coprinopsis cinerea AmutBmut pab1-1]
MRDVTVSSAKRIKPERAAAVVKALSIQPPQSPRLVPAAVIVTHPARDEQPTTTTPEAPLDNAQIGTGGSRVALTQRASLSERSLLSLIPATRSRAELEGGSTTGTDSNSNTDAEQTRARKRQRIESTSSPAATLTASTPTPSSSRYIMRLSESTHNSILSPSPNPTVEAGPSSRGYDGVPPTNGHTNGCSYPAMTNGSSGAGGGMPKHGKVISKLNLPGTTLYEDSSILREEFVRLVVQTLRDVGYIESAATLEAESGYELEAPKVTQFRQYILDGMWLKAEEALDHLNVVDEDDLLDAKFLIKQQKYLELLEAKKTTAALHVLRNELAPLNVDSDHLHTLSSLIMCSEPEDLRRRAQWDGASGDSRRQLLISLHNHIPSSVMIPERRFSTLLQQALTYQRHHCLYHNTASDAASFSLYSDHQCSKGGFPNVTTTILNVHTDEVWNMEWSHDGRYLASAGKDKMAIIWKMGSTVESGSPQDWTAHVTIPEHPDPIGALAWSVDDTVLVTSAEHLIKMWKAKTGVCIRTLSGHSDTISSLQWLPDGSGFFSGALDRKIVHWDADGKLVDDWGTTAIRITGFCITPDGTRLVAVGMEHIYTPNGHAPDGRGQADGTGSHEASSGSSKGGNKMIVYDIKTKQILWSVRLEGELTSVKVSPNSQYALINHAPEVIYLYDIQNFRLANKYVGQQQGQHIIKSCFGGANASFIVSGSEDGNVYVWHRDSSTLLEVLSGHGQGSVNSVAWHPHNERLFASCSDDHTIRIWEAPPPETLPALPPPQHLESSAMSNGKGKGRVRQPWEDEVDNGIS